MITTASQADIVVIIHRQKAKTLHAIKSMDAFLAYVTLCTLFAKQFIPLHRKQDLKNSLPECPELYHKYLYTHKISTQALKQGGVQLGCVLHMVHPEFNTLGLG